MSTSGEKPLRILLTVESCGAGVGRHVVDLAQGLIGLGHSVDLVYSAERADARFIAGLERLGRAGCRVHEIGFVRSPGLKDVAHVRVLRQLIRRQGPFDVIHAHSSKAGALTRLAVGKGRTARIYSPHAFFTMHPGMGRRGMFLYGTIERMLSRRCEVIIANSDQEKAHAASLRILGDQVHTVHNGLELAPTSERSEARALLGVADDVPVVGFVGRLSPQKAPEVAVAAFRKLLESMPEARLVMIGDGESLPELRRSTADLGDAVDWRGDFDAPTVIAGFDVLLLPSRYESFGYVLLEALVNGVPVVSTPVGIAEQVVSDPSMGMIVPIDDAEAMGEGLRSVLERKRQGEAFVTSLAMVEPYSRDAMVKNIERIYRLAIAACGG